VLDLYDKALWKGKPHKHCQSIFFGGATLEECLLGTRMPRNMKYIGFLSVLGVLILSRGLWAEQVCQNPVYEGFGANTPGGSNQTVYRVTNLNNSGPGSLRDAVSQGNRCVVFDVGGEILSSSYINIRDSFITVDGLTAPTPITIRKWGIQLRGSTDPFSSSNAHDIIVRGLRFHPEEVPSSVDIDSLAVEYSAHNVVIDHNTFYGPSRYPFGGIDEHIDIGQDAHDVTISWNSFSRFTGGGTKKHLLVAGRGSKTSIHHNLFSDANERSPSINYDVFSVAVDHDVTADIRNNYITTKRGAYSTWINFGAKANVINNYYVVLPIQPFTLDATNAYRFLFVCNLPRLVELGALNLVGRCTDIPVSGNVPHDAFAYVHGNVIEGTFPAGVPNGDDFNTESVPYSVPFVTTTSAKTAACQVYQSAGVRPFDVSEQALFNRVPTPTNCGTPSPPGQLRFVLTP